jgi:outer membrane immunogenic protein
MKKFALVVAAIATLIEGPAFAGGMATKDPPLVSSPPPPAALSSWNGFYIGGNVGWGWGDANTSGNLTHAQPQFPLLVTTTTFAEHLKQNGPSGGVQAGYNWQRANAILGIETDIQLAGQRSTGNHQSSGSAIGGLFTTTQSITNHDSLDWFGTVRGRIGYAIWPSTMVYATGGFAYGGLRDKTSVSTTDNTAGVLVTQFNGSAAASTIKTGFAAGAGMEGWVPNSPLTWKVEYLYVNLGTANYNLTAGGTTTTSVVGGIPVSSVAGSAPATISNKFIDNILRVGVNYHF